MRIRVVTAVIRPSDVGGDYGRNSATSPVPEPTYALRRARQHGPRPTAGCRSRGCRRSDRRGSRPASAPLLRPPREPPVGRVTSSPTRSVPAPAITSVTIPRAPGDARPAAGPRIGSAVARFPPPRICSGLPTGRVAKYRSLLTRTTYVAKGSSQLREPPTSSVLRLAWPVSTCWRRLISWAALVRAHATSGTS